MEGLLSEFAAPSLTRKTHCRVGLSLSIPSQRQAHGTSVDIEKSVALRATPVKARSRWFLALFSQTDRPSLAPFDDQGYLSL